jgi:hypothetical protein
MLVSVFEMPWIERMALSTLPDRRLRRQCDRTVGPRRADPGAVARALDSLTVQQKATIQRSARLVPLSVPTVEMAGGSVRCMIAGIHLSPRGA